ncbi:copper resistance D family protein [Steroidobacter flavus]|uniref:Copper resistance protein D n=1 Tax=Steroidobacter flavus TaxID=1842136 RepID=A0ABV8SZ49_9GAMM
MLDALSMMLKALLYAGILAGAGAVFAQATLRPQPDSVRFLSQLSQRGAALTILAALANAVCLIFRLGGEFDTATLSAVFLSGVGAAICLQVTGSALLLLGAHDGESARAMQLSNAILVTASFAFNGHAAAEGFTTGLVALLHVSLAAWWFAALWVLRDACLHADFNEAATLVRRFSTIAFGLVGGLVIAGLLLVGALVEFDRDPWLSGYGQWLAVKIAIVGIALGLASYNKIRLTPQLVAGDVRAARSLGRMIDAELICIGAVLIATAILTTYTSPHQGE